MSFDINWNKLIEDDSINKAIQLFLDKQFQKIKLPNYISNLSVTDFHLGDIPPDLTIRHIGDPFDEFYTEEQELPTPPIPPQQQQQQQPPQPTDEDDHCSYNEDEDNEEDNVDDDDYVNGLASITERMGIFNFNQPLTSTAMPTTTPSKQSSTTATSSATPNSTNNRSRDSLSMLHPPLGVNTIIGIGAPTTKTGSDTPTTILNQNYRLPSLPKITSKRKSLQDENDIQLIVEINYKGNLHINLIVNLLVNYPSPNFISLPIKLHITDIVIHSIATIAYLKKSIYLSFLCDITDESSDYFSHQPIPKSTPLSNVNSGGNFVDYYSGGGAAGGAGGDSIKERIDIIKKIRIESEIGEVENNVLRNVGKVEKFLIEQLRNLIRDEIAWPSWICIDLNEEEEESSDEEGEGNEEDDSEEEGDTSGSSEDSETLNNSEST
ncbi:uncharacterized protein J8A68_001467 [[Candida] subhashii]|uniref:Mitochondrial distribution and morphology protein 12 n=1 Tax=[Candida] subhashii TaxID=561895 RepID=A0A8J5QU29_9ASCO|nr:uncharacterized protein J8A68_001467 [[Candida] subhashii]KAG7665002.1 hypothetical protein J8A68_001467 [[Candida] subhashii]